MPDVFKDLIPTPVRAYARQFSDNQKPLTADFFKPQEMNALVDLIAQSKRTLRSPSINTSDEEYANMIGREPGHVRYEDYHPLEKRPGANFMESVLPLSSDSPLESLRHTLGNFAYEQVVNPQTGEIQYRVTDEYNWDPVYGDYGLADTAGTKRGGGRYPEWKDLLNIIAGRSGPAKTGQQGTRKYTPVQRLSNIMEWAGGMFGPRSSEGEGMRFDVTVPTGEYEELANALAQSRMPNVPQQDARILDDEMLRHHYMNIAKGTAVENEDGSLSTVYSTSVQHPDLNDGEPTLVPSVWDGEILVKKDKDGNPIRRPDGKTIVDEDKAAEKAIKSGRKWTSASTHEQLRAHDILLHQGMKRISPEEAEIELLRWAK